MDNGEAFRVVKRMWLTSKPSHSSVAAWTSAADLNELVHILFPLLLSLFSSLFCSLFPSPCSPRETWVRGRGKLGRKCERCIVFSGWMWVEATWNFYVFSSHIWHFLLKKTHPRICLLILESEEGREKEKHWCERDTSIGCLLFCSPTRERTHNLGTCPDWESNLQSFWCTGRCSNQLSHLARAIFALNYQTLLCGSLTLTHWWVMLPSPHGPP